MGKRSEELSERYRRNAVSFAALSKRILQFDDELSRSQAGVSAQLARCRAHRPGGGCPCAVPSTSGCYRSPTWRVLSHARSEFLVSLHREYHAGRDPAVRDELAAAYDDFALSVARGLHTRRESIEDLAQVARIGLLQAIDRFEPGLGRPFPAYARATIVGELKRHIRDRTWVMRVPRSLQENYLAVVRAADDLAQELQCSPTVADVAGRTGLSEEHVLEAIELGAVQPPASLDAPSPDGRTPDPPAVDESLGRAEGRTYFSEVLSRLPEREREILVLRFVDGLTQTQIGRRLGVSQMYVSRTLNRTLARLRALMRLG